MGSEKGQGAALLLILLALGVALAAMCALSGNAVITDESGGVIIGKPADFAQATGIARAAELAREATRQAINYIATQDTANGRATATAAAAQGQATATAFAQVAHATQTAVPYQAAIAKTEADTKVVWLWTVALATIGGGLAALLIAFALAAWVRTRSKVAWVGPNGPVVLVGNTLIDAGKMIGPAVTVPGDDKLIELERVRHYLATGQIITKPLTQVQLTDGGAGADHYLAAAQVAGHTNAIGAMFRPDNASRGRDDKLKILDKRQAQPMIQAALPAVRVIDDPQKIEDFGRLLESEGR